MYATIGRFWLDISALFSSAVVLAYGGYLGWNNSPICLNRAGSVIIVIGVLVAACRFHDRLKANLGEVIESNDNVILENVKTKLETRLGESIKPEQVKEIHSSLRDVFHKEVAPFFEAEKQRIKLLEIFLIVGGTLINGFGDYVICLLRAST